MDAKPKGRRWMRVLLIASLGLNLLVAGAFVGSRFSERPNPRGHSDNFLIGQNLGPYGRAFSKEDRAALRKSIRSRGTAFKKSRGEMRALGVELVAALRATPFDAGAVRDVLSKQRDVQVALQNEGQDVLIERLTEMTPEARARFADNLEKGLKRGRKR